MQSSASDSNHRTPDQQEKQKVNQDDGAGESMLSKFKQLPSQKQFALITLASLGTAMLITGRTVRVIMKRAPQTHSPSHQVPNQHDLITASRQHITRPDGSAQSIRPGGLMARFWDDKSNERVEEINLEERGSRGKEEEKLNFNPALDAIGAFGLATILVIGTSTLTVRWLSKRWELDSWDDWRIFLEAGHLGKAILPPDWSPRISRAIPNRVRAPTRPLNQDEEDLLQASDAWAWKRSLDREWEEEQSRRQLERLQWENQRRILGKRVW